MDGLNVLYVYQLVRRLRVIRTFSFGKHNENEANGFQPPIFSFSPFLPPPPPPTNFLPLPFALSSTKRKICFFTDSKLMTPKRDGGEEEANLWRPRRSGPELKKNVRNDRPPNSRKLRSLKGSRLNFPKCVTLNLKCQI